MSSICIIPARGGSKRIPSKNIKLFLGKHIIAYSIEAALQSGLFEEVMVSTDDQEIATVARRYGATVPFFRSVENADDHATLVDVLLEVVDCFTKTGKSWDTICCILPTAPFVTSAQIQEGFLKLNQEKLDSVCPVVTFSYPIFRALELTTDEKLKMIWPEHLKTRSQDLKPAYHDAGSFYWVQAPALLNEHSCFCRNGSAIILPETEVQDIDTFEDWEMAELKYQMLHASKNHPVQG